LCSAAAWPGHQLCRLDFFMVFLCPFWQIPN
jgi:hypothetical protein